MDKAEMIALMVASMSVATDDSDRDIDQRVDLAERIWQRVLVKNP